MIVSLNDFIREFSKIKDRGWIKTHRAGPTGVGKTLEDLLGIVENNIGEPDFGEYELKSARIDSNSMLTMFTKSPEPARSNKVLLDKYGYLSDAYKNRRKVLHSTLSADRFTPVDGGRNMLKIHCSDDRISIESEQYGIENIYWEKETLRKVFDRKYKNKFVYVKALSRGKRKEEEFKYCEAFEISGFNYDSFVDLLEKGSIKVDIRIGQYEDGRTHDHGTAFRILQRDFDLLFNERRSLV